MSNGTSLKVVSLTVFLNTSLTNFLSKQTATIFDSGVFAWSEAHLIWKQKDIQFLQRSNGHTVASFSIFRSTAYLCLFQSKNF